MSVTNNGKKAEQAIQTVLKSLSDEPNFDWQRMYDATSARSAFMAQTGDFQFFVPNAHGVIEVKSTKSSTRLPKTAFSENQLLKLKRRYQAGGHVYIIVWSYSTNEWRLIPYSDIEQTFLVNKASSIVLPSYTPYPNATSVVSKLLDNVME